MRKLVDATMVKAFKIARKKLLAVLPKLEEKGWTRDDLFRVGKFSYPHGPWGIAWSPLWLKPSLKIYLQDGILVFKWVENGRVIKQTARPEFSIYN